MNLHMPEDAASLLEQFVHDVANAPAEITHLLEEIQAKDRLILTYKDEISKRDAAIQKWVRLNGGHVLNPKEEAYSKTINDCLDKCDVLQAEKCGLGEKALIVLERQIRRLDVGLRSLSVREEFPSDWNGPSMLSGSATSVSTPASGGVSGVGAASGPLQTVSGNISSTNPGGPNIANAAQLRMAQSSSNHRGPTLQTPATAPRPTREPSSEATTSTKRRRPNASLGALPTAASHLRQSSLGPGTPKAGTPNPATTSSRQSSAQPTRPNAASTQKKAPAATTSIRKPPPITTSTSRKRARPSSTKKLDRRRALQTASARNTASPTPSSDRSSASPSPTAVPRTDGVGGSDAEAEEEGDDTTLYCFCQKVSFGDMVGCDNDECKYQWFHWGCVGLRSEPMGEWLCPECRGEVKG